SASDVSGRRKLSSEIPAPSNLFRERPASAQSGTVNRIGQCLRPRFSNASSVLRFGFGLPVTSTGVPLQTPHKSMHDASTVRHCRRIAFGVKHIFSSHFLHHILCCESTCRNRRAVFRAAIFTSY